MSEITDTAKNNPLMTIVIAAMVTGGGLNVLSEGTEKEENEQMAAEFRMADINQDQRQKDLADLYHELDKRLAIIEHDMEKMDQ